MKLREHPRSDELATWIAKQVASAKPLRGEFYRVAGPRHTTAKEIISGTGAFIAGGRWSPPEMMKAVYLSEEPETAMHEANAHFRYYRLPLWKGMPRVVVGVRVVLETLLDLTTRSVAISLPEPMKLLLAEDWRAIMAHGNEATTQALGRAAYQAGIQAIRTPSKPDPQGFNLTVFPERFTKNSQLEVLNEAELDKLGRAT
jgi:RES domain-containing protein